MSDPCYFQSMIVIWAAAAATTTDPVIYQLFQRLIREAQEQIGDNTHRRQDTIEIKEQKGFSA